MEPAEEDCLSAVTQIGAGKWLVGKCLSLDPQHPYEKAGVVCFPVILVARRQKQEDPRDG